MKLLELIRSESKVPVGRWFFIATVSAVANTSILIIINVGLERMTQGQPTFRLFFLFLVLLVVFAITRRHLLISVSREFEQILHRVRSRVADKVRRADLLRLEGLERAGIYGSVQRETLAISSIGRPLVTVFQAILLLILTLLYILYLSKWAFVFVAGIILGTCFFYIAGKRQLSGALQDVLNSENRVYESLSHILDGIKEVQLNVPRSNDLMRHALSRSEVARNQRIKIDSRFIDLTIFARILVLGGLGFLVFVLPHQQFAALGDNLTQITLAFIFLIGPLFDTVGWIPDLYQAEVAVNSIQEIESKLDQALRPVSEEELEPASFKEIVLDDLFFQFEDPRSKHPFDLGPVNLTVSAGEVLFLTGGNGSGKSTLLKLVTALYHPRQGSIRWDGIRVEGNSIHSYQSLFSTVFSDFHLFDRLYGLEQVDPARIEELFEDLELTGKTAVVNGSFETLNLSTGQRKRLALAVAILEDRPILVLDEWAAEQDPEFRKNFYHKIIPRLKAADKTIIAVTHDDRYFSAANRVLRMEEGRLVPLTAGNEA